MIAISTRFSKWALQLLYIIAFLLPIGRVSTSIPMLFLTITIFLVWFFEKKKIIFNAYLVIISLILFVPLIDCIIRNDCDIILSKCLLYLPVLLFSFVFSTITFSKEDYHKLVLFFIAGCVVSSLSGYVFSIIQFVTTQKTLFYYVHLSLIHPTYISVYIIFIVVFLIAEKNIILIHSPSLTRVFIIFIVFYFVVYLILLSSRISIISIVIIGFFLFIYYYTKEKEYGLRNVISILMLLLFISVVIYQYKPVYSRFKQLAHLNENNSASERLIMWEIAWNITKDNFPFGTGKKEAQILLNNEYQKIGFHKGYLKEFNTHNQYLQYLLTYGLTGVLLLVLIFVSFLKLAWKNRHITYACFLLLLLIVFLTESFLEAQNGVVFFGLFGCMFPALLVKSE